MKNNKPTPRKKSKRERRNKMLVYIMVIAMLLSTLSAGLSMFF